MSNDSFDYYQHQQQKAAKPWIRDNNSRVAVNPERITTLLKLAIEHYGRKCARCGSKKRLTVHHRHYRAIGYEKPVEDIVLLCGKCHEDLHERGKDKKLNRNDLPYVDPAWAEWLKDVTPPEERKKDSASGGFDPVWPKYMWKAVFRDEDGQEWVSFAIFSGEEIALKEFSARQRGYDSRNWCRWRI